MPRTKVIFPLIISSPVFQNGLGLNTLSSVIQSQGKTRHIKNMITDLKQIYCNVL